MKVEIVGGIIVRDKDKTLLLQQGPDGSQANRWGPPAGHGNPGETPLETALRETKEETGLDIKVTRFLQGGMLVAEEKGKTYIVAFWEGVPINISQFRLDPVEAVASVWASLSEIIENKYPLRKKFVLSAITKCLTDNHDQEDCFVNYSWED